jgi:hypothetical protein
VTLLREIPRVKQHAGEPPRRWFTDETMDLYVWAGDDCRIIGFQLTYNKLRAEKAIRVAAKIKYPILLVYSPSFCVAARVT